MIERSKLDEAHDKALIQMSNAKEELGQGKSLRQRILEHPEMAGTAVGGVLHSSRHGLMYKQTVDKGRGLFVDITNRSKTKLKNGLPIFFQYKQSVEPKILSAELVAIYRGWKDISKRQQNILNQLSSAGFHTILKKEEVNVTDLAALTAYTGNEFAMFTLGSRRNIFRGESTGVIILPSELNKLKSEKWRWSAHTHPGDTTAHLQPSGNSGDRGVLMFFDQEQSLILNSLGRRKVFNRTGDQDLDIAVKMRNKTYENS